MRNFLQKTSDILDQGAVWLRALISKILREYIAEYTNYQPAVYPPVSANNGSANAMYTSLWANLDSQAKHIPNWDFLHFTSNVAGSFQPTVPGDNGNITYFGDPLDIHGHHDIVVWPSQTRMNLPLGNYVTYLSGLGFFNVPPTSITQNMIQENTLSNYPQYIVWSFPFLVKPNGTPYYEDLTRLLGITPMYVEPGAQVVVFTRASTDFTQPDLNPPPSWYTFSFGNMAVALQILFFFCCTIQDHKDGSVVVSMTGSPSSMYSREVVEPLDVVLPGEID